MSVQNQWQGPKVPLRGPQLKVTNFCCHPLGFGRRGEGSVVFEQQPEKSTSPLMWPVHAQCRAVLKEHVLVESGGLQPPRRSSFGLGFFFFPFWVVLIEGAGLQSKGSQPEPQPFFHALLGPNFGVKACLQSKGKVWTQIQA